MWNASRFCVSSLRRGHANLLCIVPILVYVPPKRVRSTLTAKLYMSLTVARQWRYPFSRCFTQNTSLENYFPCAASCYLRSEWLIEVCVCIAYYITPRSESIISTKTHKLSSVRREGQHLRTSQLSNYPIDSAASIPEIDVHMFYRPCLLFILQLNSI